MHFTSIMETVTSRTAGLKLRTNLAAWVPAQLAEMAARRGKKTVVADEKGTEAKRLHEPNRYGWNKIKVAYIIIIIIITLV